MNSHSIYLNLDAAGLRFPGGHVDYDEDGRIGVTFDAKVFGHDEGNEGGYMTARITLSGDTAEIQDFVRRLTDSVASALAVATDVSAPAPEKAALLCAICGESIVDGEDAHVFDANAGGEVHTSCSVVDLFASTPAETDPRVGSSPANRTCQCGAVIQHLGGTVWAKVGTGGTHCPYPNSARVHTPVEVG